MIPVAAKRGKRIAVIYLLVVVVEKLNLFLVFCSFCVKNDLTVFFLFDDNDELPPKRCF